MIAEGVHAGLRLKLLRTVVGNDPFIGDGFSGYRDDLLRQLQHRACLLVLPVGMDAGDDILDIPLHFEVDEILAVDDAHPVISPPGLMEPHRVAVPLIFPAIGIQYRPIHTAQGTAQGYRDGKVKSRP